MADISKDVVLDRLRGIRGPDDDRDIVRRGMVSDIVIANDRVMFSITVPAERADAKNRSSAMGKFRSASSRRMTPPT